MELDEHYLHRKLDERIGVLPQELRQPSPTRLRVGKAGVRPNRHVHDTPEVRLGAAKGFRERAHREIVEPVRPRWCRWFATGCRRTRRGRG